MNLNSRDSELKRAQRLLAHDSEAHASEAMVPAIAQTSLFTFESYAEMAETFAGNRSRNVYSRTTNPTVTLFEQKIAAPEHAEDAIGFPSRMAAISGAVLAFVQPQDRIVAMQDGIAQQVGTPAELYGNPANLFVAGFIGTPAMNFRAEPVC
ncbi:MAG: PLP-dependent transferase [Steroidobacteraceae bacterium]